MATIKTIFRPSSNGGEYVGSLCIRIIHKRKIKYITLPFKIYPKEWDYSNTEISLKNSKHERLSYLIDINERLWYIHQVFQKTLNKLEEQDTYSLEDIVNEYNLRMNNGSLSCFVNKVCYELIKTGQFRTARAYKSALNKFLKFNNKKDLLLNDINANIMKCYERKLKENGLKLNTISFYIRNIRVIYNRAVEQGYIEAKKENPFKKVYTKTQKTKKRALSIDEINSLNLIDFQNILKKKKNKISTEKRGNRKLYFSWRLFFFCFYSRGMSFVDLAYLRKENLQGEFINYYRKKSGQYISVKVNLSMRQIIDSFADEVKDSPYIFPIITDQTKSPYLQYESALRVQNRRLKKIADLAHINSVISTHVSRHSWASVAKTINLPVSVISEGLGHANELTTTIYLASFNHSVLDNANDVIVSVANNKKIHRPKYYDRNHPNFYCIS